MDEILRDTLGEDSIKKIILQDIVGGNFQWNEIPKRLQVFIDTLHKLDSSSIIENLILETVYSNLNLTLILNGGKVTSF